MSSLIGHGIQNFDYIFDIDGSYYVCTDRSGQLAFPANTSFSTLFNAAVNALSGTGGAIYLTPNTYVVDAVLTLDENSVVVEGGGWDSLLTLDDDVDDNMILISANNCFLRNFRMFGNNANNVSTNHGIFVFRSAGHRIENLKIYDFEDDDIHISEPGGDFSTVQCLGGKIYNNYIGDTTNQTLGNGIYLDWGATDWEVYANVVAEHEQAGKAGFVIDGDNNHLSKNHCWGNYYNYLLAVNNSLAGLQLVGDKCMDNKRHGIYKASGQVWKNSVISGCLFWRQGEDADDTYDSIHVTSGGTTRGIAVTGCVFRGELDNGNHQARYAVNWGTNVTQCTFGFNAIEGYTNAAPINISDLVNNEVEHNKPFDNS